MSNRHRSGLPDRRRGRRDLSVMLHRHSRTVPVGWLEGRRVS